MMKFRLELRVMSRAETLEGEIQLDLNRLLKQFFNQVCTLEWETMDKFFFQSRNKLYQTKTR